MKTRLAALLLAAPLALLAASPAPPAHAADTMTEQITVATFNASLNRGADGQLRADLADGGNEQARNAAETIQLSGADIVLVNEFDYDPDGEAVDLFRKNYLEVSQNGAPAAEYPYAWAGPVNTGVPSGFDLNNDGTVGGPDDALGFGFFPGQYGFVVYSKYPIDTEQVRTFQNFLWKDMPDALLPAHPDGTPWYDDEELAVMPLSSKTHADIPVDVNGTTVHVLAAHPTPPSFDGAEQRNKKRNFDEIRIWSDYIAGEADYLYDDAGVRGGLAADANFVIVGDYNSDPVDGDSWPGAIQQLLESPLVHDPMPASDGAVEAAALQGGANAAHGGDPRYDTADFNDNPAPGNLRVDYVLPNAAAEVADASVFWPTRDDELVRLTGEYPFPTSDHRLVQVTLSFPAAVAEPGPTDPGPTGTGAPTPTETGGTAPTSSPSETPGTSAPATPERPAAEAMLPATGAEPLPAALASLLALAGGTALLLRRRRAA